MLTAIGKKITPRCKPSTPTTHAAVASVSGSGPTKSNTVQQGGSTSSCGGKKPNAPATHDVASSISGSGQQGSAWSSTGEDQNQGVPKVLEAGRE